MAGYIAAHAYTVNTTRKLGVVGVLSERAIPVPYT